MSRNAVETIVGAVVLVVAAVFLFFAYTTTQVNATGGTEYTAQFDRVDGLRDGSDVKISGIKVGTVESQSLDPKTFLATIKLAIDPNIKLPDDSVAVITSPGLLGDNFVSIEPGNDDKVIPPGGRIVHTQAAMNLQSLIGQAIYGGNQNKGQGGGVSPGPQPSPAPKP
ncbi:MAG: outer membrane lipid asymmetry maintenance protein MlaD [Stellaceae bacterium]